MDDENVDYKKMYFELMTKVSSAIDILVEAQLSGEDAYIEAGE